MIIVHGAYGHPEENWFDWLRQALAVMNIDCCVPTLPTPEQQNLENWLAVFQQSCGHEIHSNTIIVGHSLGAVFVLRWLEQYAYKVRATILVGAFIGEVGIKQFDEINKSFFLMPFQWKKIKARAEIFVSYGGDNDTYIPLSQFHFIADQLAAKKIVIFHGGHLNAAAGYTTFPELLLQLKALIEE